MNIYFEVKIVGLKELLLSNKFLQEQHESTSSIKIRLAKFNCQQIIIGMCGRSMIYSVFMGMVVEIPPSKREWTHVTGMGQVRQSPT